MFLSCISVPHVKQIILVFINQTSSNLDMDVGERRGGGESTGSRGGKDGCEKRREKEMIGKHMNNPQVLITFLHMCSFVRFL